MDLLFCIAVVLRIKVYSQLTACMCSKKYFVLPLYVNVKTLLSGQFWPGIKLIAVSKVKPKDMVRN